MARPASVAHTPAFHGGELKLIDLLTLGASLAARLAEFLMSKSRAHLNEYCEHARRPIVVRRRPG
jgi:hypothetical protein